MREMIYLDKISRYKDDGTVYNKDVICVRQLLELFIVFAKIGSFTFGGGYAMLPIIQEEIVDKRGWASEEEVIDYYAIGQCTPGIISVNTATFIGYKLRGIAGALFATLGIISPSIVIITTIATFFTHFQDYKVVQHAFGGIRVAVVALILNAIAQMWGKSVKDYVGVIIFIVAFVTVAFMNVSPIIIIVISAIAGIVIQDRRAAMK